MRLCISAFSAASDGFLWKRPGDFQTIETHRGSFLLYVLFFVDFLPIVLMLSAILVKEQTCRMYMSVWAYIYLHDREGFTQLP